MSVIFWDRPPEGKHWPENLDNPRTLDDIYISLFEERFLSEVQETV